MSESLAGRVKRLISGSANMVVSAMEDMAPEMVMEEAIREIDTAIDDIRVELGQVMTRQYHASQRIGSENQRHEDLSEKIRVALREERADLAEAGVARLLDIEAQIPLLESVLAETRETQAELEGYISALQARRREMREELKQFLNATQSAATQPEVLGAADSASGVERRVEKASQSFDRIMERASGVGRGDIALDRKTLAATAELEELARRNRVKERMVAFRERG
ncbi:PspA/IM30 family protein [Pelagibius sp. Alg239-R121]|uniref:PspA/IM30 family protein n=1 Tax=Pelagibius sp. Alg239-R121 TaxID=2993448 RepID=UPI0024A79400|nr:PspA/IM30 family protein [Pelagibius sp. Alg239-R121]